MDEVGSQLEGLELTGNGTEVHVSGSTGRQLAPGLLYIDDKKQNSAKVKLKIIWKTPKNLNTSCLLQVWENIFMRHKVFSENNLTSRHQIIHILCRQKCDTIFSLSNESLKKISPFTQNYQVMKYFLSSVAILIVQHFLATVLNNLSKLWRTLNNYLAFPLNNSSEWSLISFLLSHC